LLEALGDLGFPIVDERRDLSAEKVYRLLDNYAKKLPNLSLPSFDLNDQERFYLDAILEGHSLHSHSTGALLSSLRAKLHALLPELDADPISADSPGPSPSSSEDLLATIRTAIKTSQALSVVYRSPVDAIARSYVLYPIKLLEHRGGLYLLAKPEAQAAVRLLDIDLFEHATLAAHTPEHPVDIDYAAMASLFDLEADDPVDATIRFAPAAATKIQSRYFGQLHSTKLNRDGSYTVQIGSRNLRELLRWVLSFGPDAEVLAPLELRSMTRKELAQTLAQYDSNRPSCP
jgi:proteasome accessory factor B